MSLRHDAIVFALVVTLAAPVQVWAFGGGGGGAGCSNLPDYARAAGALEGLSSCDMTIEQARRIVAAHDGQGATEQVAPTPHHYRRHRTPATQQ